MKGLSKSVLTVLGEHILYIVLSFVLANFLGTIFKKCLYVVSIITALIYVCSIYSAGWHESGKNLRSANEKVRLNPGIKNPYRIYNGFVIALPMFLISLFLFVMSKTLGEGLWRTLFRLYNAAFLFLFKLKGVTIFVEILALFLPFTAYGLGYIAGKNKKIFVTKHFNKLIYKKKAE